MVWGRKNKNFIHKGGKMKIEKWKFEAYENIRKTGVINMLDVNIGCMMSGLSHEEWTEITKQYSELKKKYGVDDDNLEK